MNIQATLPRRHGFAYIPALLVPYSGRMGAGLGFIAMIYIIGVNSGLIAIPAPIKP